MLQNFEKNYFLLQICIILKKNTPIRHEMFEILVPGGTVNNSMRKKLFKIREIDKYSSDQQNETKFI